MWWEDRDFSTFKQQAFQELLDYLDCHPGMTAKEAFQLMYRSTIDYEGEMICVSAVESVSSLSTISCSPSGDSELQDKGICDLWDAVGEDNLVANDVEESNLAPDAIEVIGELTTYTLDCGDEAQKCGFEDAVDKSDSKENVSLEAPTAYVTTPRLDGQVRSVERGRDEYLRSLLSESTIWYDLELMRMQTQRIVLLRGSDADAAMSGGDQYNTGNSIDVTSDIAKAIDERSQKGPDFVLSFVVLSAALVYIFVIAAMANYPPLMRVASRLPNLWCTAFVINVIAVSVPGRLDRMYSDGTHIKPWLSLFEPSPWAFAIWGVIYLTELLVTVYLCVFYKSMSSEFGAQGFPSALPYWTAGNCLQALWCFVFRPEFKSRLWIPSCCLFLSSLSLLGAYMQLPSSGIIFVVAKLSLALHTSWLFCLTMITLNSWLALSGVFQRMSGLATVVALSSSLVAMLGGVLLSMYSSDISFALTCAWALDALASRSMDKSKLIYKSQSDMDVPDAELLQALSTIETVMSTFLKFISVYITITVQVLGAIAPIHQ